MSKAAIGMFDKIIPFGTEFEIKKQEAEDDAFFVEGFASTSDLDDQGDIITFPALKKAAKGLLKDFTTALFNHDQDRPIGKIVEAEAIEGKGLRVKIQISGAEAEIRRKVEEGIINKFSIRGRALKIERKFDESKDVMLFIIHEIELVEVSLVSLPANRQARVTGFERVPTSAKSLVGAVMKSFNDSQTKGGEETMDPNAKTKEEEATPAEATTPEEGTKPAEGAAPAAPEAPAAPAPEAKPAEGGEAPAPEGGEPEKSLRQLAGRMAAASGAELEKIKAEMSALISGKATPAPAAAVVVEATPEGIKTIAMTEQQVSAMVARQVASATSVRKGEGTAPEATAPAEGTEGKTVKAFDSYPPGNKMVVLCANLFDRAHDLKR